MVKLSPWPGLCTSGVTRPETATSFPKRQLTGVLGLATTTRWLRTEPGDEAAGLLFLEQFFAQDPCCLERWFCTTVVFTGSANSAPNRSVSEPSRVSSTRYRSNYPPICSGAPGCARPNPPCRSTTRGGRKRAPRLG